MIRTALAFAAASALVFHLGGCQRGPATPAPSASEAEASPVQASQAPLAAANPADTPPQPSLSRRPEEVLDAFAAAIEARDWRAMRAFWGEHGTRSGMDEAAFAANWSKLKSPTVSVGRGQQEGAAGSIYYTAPVVVTDGERTIAGEVVLRRVNDVPGATSEQLRWHVESTTLEP